MSRFRTDTAQACRTVAGRLAGLRAALPTGRLCWLPAADTTAIQGACSNAAAALNESWDWIPVPLATQARALRGVVAGHAKRRVLAATAAELRDLEDALAEAARILTEIAMRAAARQETAC